MKKLILLLAAAASLFLSAADVNLTGWQLKQYNSSQTYTFGSVTIPSGGYVIVCRGAKKAAFETYYGITLPSNVVFIDSAATVPQINGAEAYTLLNNSSVKIDTTFISVTSGGIYYRDSTNVNTFTRIAFATTSATPGSVSGTVIDKGMGVVITEVVDAANYLYEYVELYNDTGIVSNTAPVITGLAHSPATVTDGASVTVSADITDNSAVSADTCFYRLNSGTWSSMTHSGLAGNTYSYDIGSFSSGDFVEYFVKAVDDAALSSVSDTQSFTVITPVTVVINEFCSNGKTATDDDGEWIELYNYGNSAIDISGFIVTDNPAADGGTEGSVEIPSGATIPAKGYYLLLNNLTGFNTYYSLPAVGYFEYGAVDASLVLSNTGDDIYLFNADSLLIDAVNYGSTGVNPCAAPAESLSMVRSPDGKDTDNCSVDFVSNPTPTPGTGSNVTLITNLARSPFLPLQNQQDTVTCKITSPAGLKSVKLITSAYDSTDIDTYNMTAYSGDTLFRYVLPGRGNDCRFEYYVEALDSNDNLVTSGAGKFFWGYTSIPRYKENDSDGYAKWIGYNVRATGIVTVGTGVYNTAQNIINFQKNYILGAVWKNDSILSDGSETVIPGDSVVVEGTIIFSNGQTRIGNPYSKLTKYTSGHAIDTILVTASDLADTVGDIYEGLLVQINALSKKSGTWPTSGTNGLVVMNEMAIKGGSKAIDTFLVWIDSDTDIDENLEPVWPARIIGILTQYDLSSPYWSMYEIYPRAYADMLAATAVENFYLTAAVDGKDVLLNWNVDGFDNISVFRVERKYDNDQHFSIVKNLGPDIRTYRDSKADLSRNISYRIVGITADGGSIEFASVEVRRVKSIKDNSITSSQSMIKGGVWMNILSASDSDADLNLYDLSGRIVKNIFRGKINAGATRMYIDVKDVPAGSYFVSDAKGAYKNTVRINVIK